MDTEELHSSGFFNLQPDSGHCPGCSLPGVQSPDLPRSYPLSPPPPQKGLPCQATELFPSLSISFPITYLCSVHTHKTTSLEPRRNVALGSPGTHPRIPADTEALSYARAWYKMARCLCRTYAYGPIYVKSSVDTDNTQSVPVP